jgi:hypothetical protein
MSLACAQSPPHNNGIRFVDFTVGFVCIHHFQLVLIASDVCFRHQKEIPLLEGAEEFMCGNVVARLTPFHGLYLLDFLSSRPGMSSRHLRVYEYRQQGFTRILPVDRSCHTSPESYIYHIHPRACYKIYNVRDNVERQFSFPPSLRVGRP